MTVRSPFKPHYGSGQQLTAGAASASVTIGRGDKSLKVANTGLNVGYVRTGLASDGTVTATAADMAIPAGQERVFETPQDHNTLAYISPAGTTLEAMSGEGGY